MGACGAGREGVKLAAVTLKAIVHAEICLRRVVQVYGRWRLQMATRFDRRLLWSDLL